MFRRLFTFIRKWGTSSCGDSRQSEDYLSRRNVSLVRDVITEWVDLQPPWNAPRSGNEEDALNSIQILQEEDMSASTSGRSRGGALLSGIFGYDVRLVPQVQREDRQGKATGGNIGHLLNSFVRWEINSKICRELIFLFEGIDLNTFMDENLRTNELFYLVVYQVGEGLAHIHSRNIIHRDISGANLILNARAMLKITGFDQSAWGPLTSGYAGTEGYVAVEVVAHKYDKEAEPYGFACDYYSLGVVAYIMVFDICPCDCLAQRAQLGFELRHLEEVSQREMRQGSIGYPGTLPDSYTSLLGDLLNKDPKARLGDGRFLHHEFFNESRKENLIYFSNFKNEDVLKRKFCPSRLELVKEIGSGNFGSVSLCFDRKAASMVADKTCRNLTRDSVLLEIKFLEIFSGHQLFLKFLGYFRSLWKRHLKEYHIITEYFEGVGLNKFVRLNTLTRNELRYLLHQTGEALRHMHHRNVIHRDIKGPNILVNSKLQIKIIDFGLATFGPYSNEFTGTILYSAPEVLAHLFQIGSPPYGYVSDYYSLGVTVYQVGMHVIFSERLQERPDGNPTAVDWKKYAAILKNLKKSEPQDETFFDIMRGLIDAAPQKRLGDDSFLFHQYFFPENEGNWREVVENGTTERELVVAHSSSLESLSFTFVKRYSDESLLEETDEHTEQNAEDNIEDLAGTVVSMELSEILSCAIESSQFGQERRSIVHFSGPEHVSLGEEELQSETTEFSGVSKTRFFDDMNRLSEEFELTPENIEGLSEEEQEKKIRDKSCWRKLKRRLRSLRKRKKQRTKRSVGTESSSGEESLPTPGSRKKKTTCFSLKLVFRRKIKVKPKKESYERVSENEDKTESVSSHAPSEHASEIEEMESGSSAANAAKLKRRDKFSRKRKWKVKFWRKKKPAHNINTLPSTRKSDSRTKSREFDAGLNQTSASNLDKPQDRKSEGRRSTWKNLKKWFTLSN